MSHSKFVRWAACAAAALVAISAASALRGAKPAPYDPFDDFAIGMWAGSVGTGLADAAAGLGDYIHGIDELSKDIAAARARFWREYPNGPHFAQASAEFNRLLTDKDLVIAYFEVMSGRLANGNQRTTLMDLLEPLARNKLDGGIPPVCGGHFYAWVSFIRSLAKIDERWARGRSLDEYFAGLGALGPAWAKSAPAYEVYRIARNYSEFVRAGRLPTGPHAAGSYVRLLIFLGRTKRLFSGPRAEGHDVLGEVRAETEETYQDLTRLFGEAKVHQAAERVMKARLDPRYGLLANATVLGLSRVTGAVSDLQKSGAPDRVPDGLAPMTFGNGPYGAILTLLTTSGTREYLIGTVGLDIFYSMTAGRRPLGNPWKEVPGIVARLEKNYGSEAVAAASGEVMNAPKRSSDGYVLPDGPLKQAASAYDALQCLLIARHPKAFVRTLITQGLGVSGNAEVDAAYGKLLAAYAEPKVLAAAASMANPSGASLRTLHGLVGILHDEEHPPAPVPHPVQPDFIRVSNPAYLGWTGFAPGASVTLADLDVHHVPALSGTYSTGEQWHRKPVDTAKEIQSNQYDLISVDKTAARLTRTWRKPYYAEKVTQTSEQAILQVLPGGPSFPFGPSLNVMTADYKLARPIQVTSGSEPFTIAGKTVHTRWWAAVYPQRGMELTYKAWFSEQVPGGLVKQSRQIANQDGAITSWDTVAVAFHGEPSPGGSQLMAALEANYAKPELTQAPAKSAPRPWVDRRYADPIGPPAAQAHSASAAGAGAPPAQAGTAPAAVPSRPAPAGGPAIPVGARLVVQTRDAINAAGAASHREFRARLEQAVQYGGATLAPKGSEVVLKAVNQGFGGAPNLVRLLIQVESIHVNGARVQLETSAVPKIVDTSAPRPLRAGPVTLGPQGLGINGITPGRSSSQIGYDVPPGTSLAFSVLRANPQ